ncbi:hypothetical protein ABZ912_19805 [Nonomuraea angiospora]|uniref:hypothetical protein n=1 Tax=Nonomuraea angiospora TaxID=46172 RepID=UPI0033F7BDEA
MADWAITLAVGTVAAAAGAGGGHLAYGRRYKQALRRIIAASKHPRATGFGPALEDADELLGRRR